MKRTARILFCLLLALCLTAASVQQLSAVKAESGSGVIFGTDGGSPAEGEQAGEESSGNTQEVSSGIKNRDDIFVMQLEVVNNGTADNAKYVYALYSNPDGYDPASVLISGILYVPAGTEIQRAEVECDGGYYSINGSDILRLKTNVEPNNLNQLQFSPDLNRSAFAFIVNMEGKTDGAKEAKVSLILPPNDTVTLSTTVVIDASQGRFYDVMRAVRDQAISMNDQGNHVDALEARLVELGYLKEEDVSGRVTEAVMKAANQLLADNHIPQNKDSITQKGLGVIESAETKHKSEDFLSSLKNTITLFDREIPIWLLIAAGAALIVLIVLVVLLMLSRKRKAGRGRDAEASGGSGQGKPFITSADSQVGELLTIGDEPTMDLSKTGGPEGMFQGDEPTMDMNNSGYILRIRMIYGDVYLDKNLKLMEGGQVTIGRGADVTIQTNPEDTSVSHRHGVFTAAQGKLIFEDESRNGTIFNEQRTLHRGESATVPLNTKAQMDIGAHKILILLTMDS